MSLWVLSSRQLNQYSTMIKRITLLLLLGLCCFHLSAQSNKTTYLFSYFKGNGEDGLHLAWSADGLKWESLKNDQSFFTTRRGHLQTDARPMYHPRARWFVSHGLDEWLDGTGHWLRVFPRPHYLDGTTVPQSDGPRTNDQKHLGTRTVLRQSQQTIHYLLGKHHSWAF